MGQIEDLRLFALVVENRSISKAADKLHIAKSAVSRRLNLLEERFGTRLIDRAPGTWEVTATGLELYQRAVRTVSDVDEIESDFTETSQILSGPLTISVPRDYGIAHLSPELLTFKNRYPEIQLTVDFDDRAVDLNRENYDFAIRITAKVGDAVIAQQIGTTRHRLCASPSYLAENGEPECLNDLRDHTLLHFGAARRATWDFINQAGKPETIEFQPSLNSNSGDFLVNSAIKGLGIVRVPDFLADPALASGQLVAILPKLSVPDWGIYLMHADNRRLNRRMRLFSEEMKAVCTKDRHQVKFSNAADRTALI